jgi:hypothetical protein
MATTTRRRQAAKPGPGAGNAPVRRTVERRREPIDSERGGTRYLTTTTTERGGRTARRIVERRREPGQALGSSVDTTTTTTEAEGEEETSPGQPAAPQRPSQFRAGQALGGVIVGLFVWGFAENWITGGKAQAWAWVKSKFENNVTGGGTAGEAGDTGGSAAIGGIAPTPSGTTVPNLTGSSGQA